MSCSGQYNESWAIVTLAKQAGSFSGERTPPHWRPTKETSPTVPSWNSRRSSWSPRTVTPVTTHFGRVPVIAEMLGGGRDSLQGLLAACQLPVACELVPMERGPIAHKPQLAPGKRAFHDRAIEIN